MPAGAYGRYSSGLRASSGARSDLRQLHAPRAATKDPRSQRRWMTCSMDSRRDEVMARLFLDVAALDKSVFSLFEPALNAVLKLQGWRQGLLHIDGALTSTSQEEALRARVGILPALDDVWASIAALDFHCIGKARPFLYHPWKNLAKPVSTSAKSVASTNQNE